MMGNYQVRFLGDKGGAIRLRYPTKTTSHMDKLIIKILILLCIPTMIYSQSNYSRDEIYKS